MIASRLRVRRWVRIFPWIAAAAAFMPAASAGAAASFPFHVARSIPVTATGDANALAFLPDGSVAYLATGHAVTAYATDDGKLRATRSYDGEVTALAASPDGNHLYALTSAPSRLLVIDPHTLEVERSKALQAPAPDSLFEDAVAHWIYVSGGASHAISRLSSKTLGMGGSVRLEGPAGQIVDNGRGRLYAAVPQHAGVDVIDTRTMQRLSAFATPECTPTGALALDPVGRRLFIGCMSGQVAILDTDMGFIFRRVHLGASAAATRAVFAFHPAAGSGWKGGMFATAGRRIEAVRMDAFVRYGYGGSMTVPGKPRLMALSPDARQLWTVVQPSVGQGAGSADTQHPGEARILVLTGGGDRP